SGAILGTPAYMAPEQVLGHTITPATDIYALGIVTYEMLAGSPPFMGSTAQVLYAQANQLPPPLHDRRPGLPEGVYRAVGVALASGFPTPYRRRLTRRSLLAAIGAGATAFGGGGLALAILSSKSNAKPRIPGSGGVGAGGAASGKPSTPSAQVITLAGNNRLG